MGVWTAVGLIAVAALLALGLTLAFVMRFTPRPVVRELLEELGAVQE